MIEAPEYLFRLTVIWSVAIGYYWLFLRQSRPRSQRVYLLVSLIAGLMVPALPNLVDQGAVPLITPIQRTIVRAVTPTGGLGDVSRSSFPWWPALYIAGMSVLGALSLVRGYGRRRWRMEGDETTFQGYPLITHPHIPSPFTIYGRIYLPESLVGTPLGDTALLHETAHLRQRHHYDTLVVHALVFLLWFHPGIWIYRWLLAIVHEFEADAEVVRTIPRKMYGLQLLRASQTPYGALGLFSSPLKNRITMMTSTTRKSNPVVLAVLPMLLLGLLTFTCSDVLAQTRPHRAVHVNAAGAPALNTVPDGATNE